ncbi:MAG TPA: zinc ribbon domain-containing protein [Firmicutes bacterium]|nr:zinc ribbon domain-containing protein [Bacillota bacterium]
MPIYEFICRDCGQKFEELCRLGTEQIPCPACHSGETTRLISVCGFAVKSSDGSTCRSSASGGSCADCSGGSCSGCH